MAKMIGRTKSWLAWLAGAALALVFGGAGCGGAAVKYGPPPSPPLPPGSSGQSKTSVGELEASADWKIIVEAWSFAGPLVLKNGTKAQYRESDERLAAAKEAANRLAKARLLTESEAGLLAIEADKLVQLRTANRRWPTDAGPAPMCYGPALPDEVTRPCLERLAKRLPLLGNLAQGRKIHGVAMDKVLSSVESDLKVLSDNPAGYNSADRRAEAEKTRDAVKAQVEKLKQQLKATAEVKHD